MTRYFLDANHLSVAIRRPAALRERIAEQRRRGDLFGTFVPALCEVEAGLRQLASPSGHRNWLANLRKLRAWPVAEDSIRAYGEFHALARERGRALSFVDLLLLGMAHQLGAVVLTTDKDFDAFPEVDHESWVEA
jgi:predicted nucleic acid-binding protein